MAKKSNNRRLKNSLIASLVGFGAAPLLEGEDANAYSALLTRLCEAVKPTDPFEEMWVQDCGYLFWDTTRLRRQKEELINANMYQGMRVVLETLCPESEASDLTSLWSVRDEEAIAKINELLETGHLSMETVKAQTVAEIIDKVERFDRMITTSEIRRNSTLREMQRHRSFLANAMREAVVRIEDAEFTEVEPPQLEAETPALETDEVAADDSEQGTAPDGEEEHPYPNSEAAE